MKSERINLLTTLLPATCILRLQAWINRKPDGYDKPWGGGGWFSVGGEVNVDALSLREQTPRSTLMTEVSATIQADDNGSRIVGTCGVHPECSRLRRMGAWIAVFLGGPFALLFLGEFYCGNVRQASDLVDGPPFAALVVLGAVLFLNGIFYVNDLSARASATRLKCFLIHVLVAHEA